MAEVQASAEIKPQQELEVGPHHDSEEYESAEEVYEEDEEIEEIEEIEVEEDDEEGQTPVPGERELDDDEDRQNPQFIPKKGYFYEHDDRTQAEEGEEEEGGEKEEPVKEEKPKKVGKEGGDRWSHDLYDDGEQALKSTDEIVATYGYDIREEDQPPKAVRRRRYGRGPKKYTRKSEDVEAYQKPRGGYGGRGGGRRGIYNRKPSDGAAGGYEDEFPALKNVGNVSETTNVQSENPRETFNPRTESRGRGGGGGGGGRGGGRPPRTNRAFDGERDKDNRDRDNNQGFRDNNQGYRDNNQGFRDNRNQNYNDFRNDNRGRGGRGRGRRNEFTNRNRYPDRRDNPHGSSNDLGGGHTPGGGGFLSRLDHNQHQEKPQEPRNEKSYREHDDRGGKFREHDDRGGKFREHDDRGGKFREHDDRGGKFREHDDRGGKFKEHDDRSGKVVVNGAPAPTTVDKPRSEMPGSKSAKPSVTSPFTSNTEYTGSASLTANKVPSSNPASAAGAANTRYDASHRNSNGVEQEQKRHIEGRNEQRDNRDVNRRAQMKPFQNDRRSQIPPRLQQQQQQQQQMDQTGIGAGKPKRFSTQRQRQGVDQSIQQTTIPSQMIPQVVPIQAPVVTGAGPMVPSPVPNYTPQQTYYETAPANFEDFEAQVYESTGSPMTGNGTSVSPSLWGPHAAAYAQAPYPSPPAGTQVQVPPPPYPDPAAYMAATQPPGPPIYAAPPQFIQDPTLLNYAPAPAPQFAAPYHPQGFQGYAQVTPAPPPEVYHGGVTYYSTHNQIQRPPIIAVQKRPKTVLQLVEPPEKIKTTKDTQQGPGVRREEVDPNTTNISSDNGQYDSYENAELGNNPELLDPNADVDDALINKFSSLQTSNDNPEPRRAVTPIITPPPEEPESWASQMDQMSPTEKVPPPKHNIISPEPASVQGKVEEQTRLSPLPIKQVSAVTADVTSPLKEASSTPSAKVEPTEASSKSEDAPKSPTPERIVTSEESKPSISVATVDTKTISESNPTVVTESPPTASDSTPPTLTPVNDSKETAKAAPVPVTEVAPPTETNVSKQDTSIAEAAATKETVPVTVAGSTTEATAAAQVPAPTEAVAPAEVDVISIADSEKKETTTDSSPSGEAGN